MPLILHGGERQGIRRGLTGTDGCVPLQSVGNRMKGTGIRGDSHVRIHEVDAWDTGEIAALYRAGGWWDEARDSPEEIPVLIRGSLAFVVATDTSTGKAIGMGRVISDGISDGYIQDLVVLPEYRGKGVGSAMVRALIGACRRKGIRWLALIAEPGSDRFYGDLGFAMDAGDVPMRYCGDLTDDPGQ